MIDNQNDLKNALNTYKTVAFWESSVARDTDGQYLFCCLLEKNEAQINHVMIFLPKQSLDEMRDIIMSDIDRKWIKLTHGQVPGLYITDNRNICIDQSHIHRVYRINPEHSFDTDLSVAQDVMIEFSDGHRIPVQIGASMRDLKDEYFSLNSKGQQQTDFDAYISERLTDRFDQFVKAVIPSQDSGQKDAL